jgi:hypothetical protein
MNTAHISDARLAWFMAVLFTGIAAVLVATVRVFPGGFETQAIWLFVLLPGALFALPLSDLFRGLPRQAEGIVFWLLLVLLSWPWYWLVSYLLVRFFRRVPKSWDGF